MSQEEEDRRSKRKREEEELVYGTLSNGIKILKVKREDYPGFDLSLCSFAKKDWDVFSNGQKEKAGDRDWVMRPVNEHRPLATNFTAWTGILNLALRPFFNFALNFNNKKDSTNDILRGHMKEGVIDNGRLVERFAQVMTYSRFKYGFVSMSTDALVEKNFANGMGYDYASWIMILKIIASKLDTYFLLMPSEVHFEEQWLMTLNNRRYACVQMEVREREFFQMPFGGNYWFVIIHRVKKPSKEFSVRNVYTPKEPICCYDTGINRGDLSFMQKNGFNFKDNSYEPEGVVRLLDESYTRNDRERINMMALDPSPLGVFLLFKHVLNDGVVGPFNKKIFERFLKKVRGRSPYVLTTIRLRVGTSAPLCTMKQPECGHYPWFDIYTEFFDMEEVQEPLCDFLKADKHTKQNGKEYILTNPEFVEFIKNYPRGWTSDYYATDS